MDKQVPEDPFLERVNGELDKAQAQLSVDVLRDLRLARAHALQLRSKQHLRWSVGAFAASAIALCVLVVTMQWWQTTQLGVGAGLEDLPLLSASEDFELYEDLEFYQWLAFEQPRG